MKKEKIKWLPCLLSVAALASAVGCGSSQGDGAPFYPVEPDDEGRTQLYVYNSADTYDIAWLTSVKERFEEAHQQDTYWENGQQALVIVITSSRSSSLLRFSQTTISVITLVIDAG